MDKIEIPFGAYDSETLGWTYTIPKDYTAKIEDGKIIVKKEESEDEEIRKHIIDLVKDNAKSKSIPCDAEIAYLEKQKDASKAIEAVERIDKYIGEHVANAHDMKDSNPDKKYYRGWDDALGKMAGILQDVYSEAEQKEQTSDIILKAFENSKTDYSLEEREEASDYSEKVLPTSIACGESDEEFLLHKVIEAAYIAGQKEQKPPITGNDFGWIDELKHDLEHPEELDQKVDDVLKQRNGTRALEWSEEDREMKLKILKYLSTRCSVNEFEEVENWLNNLCPSWKPSEEQPEVDLEKVLSGFTGYYAHENSGEYPSAIDIARHFYELGLKAKEG